MGKQPTSTKPATTEAVQPLRRSLLSAALLSPAMWLTACGGGGTVPGTAVQLRPLSPEFSLRKAVAYSPFRSSNRDTETITSAMILEDLRLLVAGGFKLIRLFDSSDAVAKLTLKVIADNSLDMKVMLGIYVLSGNETFNAAEIARGIALAKANPSTVLAVSVGNETMVSWSFNKIDTAKMAGYISQVRAAVTQPVTTDDNWAFFTAAPRSITDVIDFVAMHTYPLADSVHAPGKWDWQQTAVPAASRAAAMMDAAINAAKQDYSAVRSYLDSIGQQAMPILIGETGWKAVASGGEAFRAHPVNQKMYFDRLTTWANAAKSSTGPASIVYFEAFDEPWKGGDDKWGLFNVARQARYVVQGLYANTQWEAGTYSATDAVYYIPVTGNGTITASRYTLYADVVTAGEARPSENFLWNAWDNGTTSTAAEQASSSAPTDAGHSTQITPVPAVWGWGMALTLPTTSDDLSNFAASGTLNFSVKTTYPGKIEVGFLTGTGTAGSAYDVYMAIGPGDYGYQNDGNWHQVSIPISVLATHGAMAFGMTDPAKSKLDLTRLTNPFVIADRYANTGKAQGSNVTTPLQVDAIYWAR